MEKTCSSSRSRGLPSVVEFVGLSVTTFETTELDFPYRKFLSDNPVLLLEHISQLLCALR